MEKQIIKEPSHTISHGENLYISPEGLQKIFQVYDPKDPAKNVEWTTEYTVELPIKLKKINCPYCIYILYKLSYDSS